MVAHRGGRLAWLMPRRATPRIPPPCTYLPVRKPAAQTPDFQNELATSPSTKAAFDSLPFAVPEPNVAGWQLVRDILHDMETSVLAGKATTKAALDEAEAKANTALADARLTANWHNGVP
jgi:maltose-binding protein MalE